MPYEVITPVFEGPFDLLLHLITSEQVDLYEVSVATIVDGFLAEVASMESLDLEVATEFLLIAATLVELKCRRLLPSQDELALDEELALWEERDLLLARLLECKTYKDLAGTFSAMVAQSSLSAPRTAGPEERFAAIAPDLLAGLTAHDLAEAMRRIAAPKPLPRVDMDHVAPIRVSVGEIITDLTLSLRHSGPVTFRAMTSHLADRIQVIAHFLALLELYKQGLVELDQGETFGELHVLWVGGEKDPLDRPVTTAPIGSDTDPEQAAPAGRGPGGWD